MGGGHFSSGCCDHLRPFLQRCHARIVSAWVSCGFCGWFSLPCCCFWWVARVSWHLRWLFGKSVRSEAGSIPDIWSKAPEAMPAKGVCFGFWIFGSLFHDRVFCHAIEGGRASRVDDFKFRSSSCHCHRRALYAVTFRGREQHRGCVASHPGKPQGDWEKDWRRQLSGIIHSPFLLQLHFISYAQLVFLL